MAIRLLHAVDTLLPNHVCKTCDMSCYLSCDQMNY